MEALRKEYAAGIPSLSIQGGLVIHNFTLHEKNGARWLGMPARSYPREDGTVGWQPIAGFLDETTRAQFQAAALSALDRYFEEHGHA